MEIEIELPEMLSYAGRWDEFSAEVFAIFKRDFIDRKPDFRGKEMRLKKYPEHDTMPATFYHMTHEGLDENNRTPCIDRSERMPWAFPVIELCDKWGLKVWPQVRGASSRLCIWVELIDEPDYIVILDVRAGYILPWTAFVLKYAHQKEKKLKEYQTYLAQTKALKAKTAQVN